MALALEISITRRLENLLTCWFVDLLARWLVDFVHRARACVKNLRCCAEWRGATPWRNVLSCFSMV